ncbi:MULTISPECIES: phosphate ABC transporter permease subunit PstC [unclassified Curtobacterium]|uniref:phosphate ABC transporter permease subunit PstC n=1 Tax=unclassified Curtobacterium TaxID=257496 RepID=UPI000DA97B2B|nr:MULTISPECIES: phosphate ABC transporter permease subunit PstC [unclassified Curtobacterium]NQW89708.1 phosphate ABC transporter permease subunit PstC [Curtobacterium sp. VKM Ac-2861]ROS37609.1 phosphate transport system permease protein [Curtobacterium sp. PhB78]TCL77432.1 phosphate ABC transporter membrane protein 1 (PhoT family) [Curtobacterium sp. PhB128]TCL93390.1 phosphate ABC transporter membrane protein 1 (PhoT family) [Curtobacterium sp. PhB138]TCU49656.1 phosphate ABC transporter m
MTTAPAQPGATVTPTKPKAVVRVGDRVFSAASVIAGGLILFVLVLVAAFLVWQSIPAFAAKVGDLPNNATNFWDYVGPLVFGTVWSALIALVIAVPLALGIALFISHYAPRRLAPVLGYVIDLLAAVPSVVYGLWGIVVLAPFVKPFYGFLNEYLGWFPLFSGQVSGTGRTILTASIVLAVMAIPIMTAVMREIFLQAPTLNEEAALALGATRWEMIRLSVLPFAKSGIVSAIMLGLGRALGETMAIALVLSVSTNVTFQMLTSQNPSTIAANIALQFAEASGTALNALIATGLILFVITLVINMLARYIVRTRVS